VKTKEILEKLEGMTMHENAVVRASWAQQLAKDLRVAVEALDYIAQARGELWGIADEALREIDL
jgi:hypothetical protein